jgi:hypothetical protein
MVHHSPIATLTRFLVLIAIGLVARKAYIFSLKSMGLNKVSKSHSDVSYHSGFAIPIKSYII